MSVGKLQISELPRGCNPDELDFNGKNTTAANNYQFKCFFIT